MDKVHLAAAQWITGSFPDSPCNALLSIASLEPLQVNLDKLSYCTALRLIMLHPSSGIAKGHKPVQAITTQSAGRLHIQGSRIYTEPPFSKGRSSAKLGPLSTLRDIPLPSHEGQHFDDKSPPGSHAINIYRSQIQTIAIPTKPKGADETAFEEWTSQVVHILDPILQETCLIVITSPPTNIKQQKGVHCSILLCHNQRPIVTTKHWSLSNHHELSLVGLIDSLPTLLQNTGDVTILLHNKSATQTLFNEKTTINGHYVMSFNKAILPWLWNPMNRIFIGWIPANYSTPAIKPYILKLGKTRLNSPPLTYYSAATSWRLTKEALITEAHILLHPKTQGKHFPDLGISLRKQKLRFIMASKNNIGTINACPNMPCPHGTILRQQTMAEPLNLLPL
ncbi:hypothetical protein AX15_003021 [Amanita polypyramis BW_CC]|nr:hypothetical protein AX15_003021 [Amanita polypyramis BW_CC]